MPLEFTVSERGVEKLIHNGYSYTKHRDQKNSIVFRCDRRDACNAFIKIGESFDDFIKIGLRI